MTCVCYSSSRLLYNRNDGIDRDSCKYKEEKIYFHNYKHFYRQDQEQYLFNITDTIPVRNKLERKCCFVHNKCSDRNVTECENAKEIQGLLKRLQGSHSTWKTWKMRVYLENLEKWGYTRKTWKNHGILSFQKSGNPEDYLHNIQ